MSPLLPSPLIQLAQPADAQRLYGLERACFAADCISLRSYRRLLCRASAQIVMVLPQPSSSSDLWGSTVILYRERAKVARIYSIAVATHARQQGVASALLAAAEQHAIARGCDRLRAEIRQDNTASLATFHKAGFVPFGRYENYYADGAAAVRVQKRLDRSQGV